MKLKTKADFKIKRMPVIFLPFSQISVASNGVSYNFVSGANKLYLKCHIDRYVLFLTGKTRLLKKRENYKDSFLYIYTTVLNPVLNKRGLWDSNEMYSYNRCFAILHKVHGISHELSKIREFLFIACTGTRVRSFAQRRAFVILPECF